MQLAPQTVEKLENAVGSGFDDGFHPWSHATQHGGLVERALAILRFSTTEHTCIRRNTVFHLLVQRIAKVRARHGTHLVCGIHWIADPNRLRHLYELFFKLVGDSPDQDEPFWRETNLTCVAEVAP
jgi:hypothetical protein